MLMSRLVHSATRPTWKRGGGGGGGRLGALGSLMVHSDLNFMVILDIQT